MQVVVRLALASDLGCILIGADRVQHARVRVVALGDEYAGLFSNSDKLSKQLTDAGEIEDEKLWRLPLNDRYDKMLNSPIADMQNIQMEGVQGQLQRLNSFSVLLIKFLGRI